LLVSLNVFSLHYFFAKLEANISANCNCCIGCTLLLAPVVVLFKYIFYSVTKYTFRIKMMSSIKSAVMQPFHRIEKILLRSWKLEQT